MILQMDIKPVSRRPISMTGVVVLIFVLFFSSVMMGADIIALSFGPLKHLGIVYPAVLDYTHIIAPCAALVLWYALGRRRPKLLAVVVCILSFETISAVADWADRQTDKVNVTAWIKPKDVAPLEDRLGFKMWETGDSHGPQIWVARMPGHADQLIAQTKRLGIFRP